MPHKMKGKVLLTTTGAATAIATRPKPAQSEVNLIVAEFRGSR